MEDTQEVMNDCLTFAPADKELCELGAWGVLVDVEERSVFLLVERESLAEKLDQLIAIVADDRKRIVDALLRAINSSKELRSMLMERAGDASLEELLGKSTIYIFVT